MSVIDAGGDVVCVVLMAVSVALWLVLFLIDRAVCAVRTFQRRRRM